MEDGNTGNTDGIQEVVGLEKAEGQIHIIKEKLQTLAHAEPLPQSDMDHLHVYLGRAIDVLKRGTDKLTDPS